MSRTSRFASFMLAAILPLGCSITTEQPPGQGAPETIYEGIEGVFVPDRGAAETGPSIVTPDTATYTAEGPFPVAMGQAAAWPAPPGLGNMARKSNGKRMEAPLPDEVMDALRADARRLPPNVHARAILEGPGALGPAAGTTQFEGPDYSQCCGGGGNVPPDPELAVGPNHIIAVVNVVFAIYDKSGNLLTGPTTFSSFFSGMGSCTGAFDPNVLYDEEAGRFVMGVDGNGTDYCVAATQTGDPTGSWNRYKFPTNINGNFFDYPHAGVGDDAIYMGANMFGAVFFAEGRLWAMDKTAMYNGTPMTVVTRSTGGESTPQPMNLHGFAQGTWPSGGPHYILTDGSFNGEDYGVWTWSDPFGANTLVDTGMFDLDAFTGVNAGSPLDAPQSGGSGLLQGNDWRVQDAEYRNGYIWMAHTIACNPGSGSVNCVRWAQIEPSTRTIQDAGVYATDGEYRMFADLAADDCDNMVMGYTKTSPSMFPAVFVAGRESTDPAGSLQTEVQVRAGDNYYSAFDGSPFRWGDYTGMTIDPDGSTFWYLGEYSKAGGGPWGTFIGSYSFDCNGEPPTEPPGQAFNPSPANGAGGVDINANMSWSAGSGATSHIVFFGTDPTPDDTEKNPEQGGTSFEPGTLAYSTTYYWKVDEKNSVDTTEGAIWSFSTRNPPPMVHVAAIDGAGPASNGNRWNAEARVLVEDDGGNPESGVLVEGAWSNGTSGSGSCTTDGAGQCLIQKNNIRNTSSVLFTVTNLSKSGFDYDSGSNVLDFLVINQGDTFPAGNQFPDAVNDSYSTSENTQLNGVNVMSNDDPGDAPATVITPNPATTLGGTVSITALGVLTYDPPADTTGTDTFDYTIEDDNGDTDTATVSVEITEPGSGPTTMSVASLTVNTVGEGGGNKRPRAVVNIVDDLGNPVGNATVTGEFTGDGADPTESGVTNGGGSATLLSDNTARGKVKFTFCVNNVTHGSLTYNAGDNAVTCASN